MGTGVNGAAARAYLLGTAHANQATRQDVYEATATGEPFSDWAGPVSVAVGLEHRQEKTRSISDAGETASPVPWFLGVPAGYTGSFSVTEGYVETVVPLARDVRTVDVDGKKRSAVIFPWGDISTVRLGVDAVGCRLYVGRAHHGGQDPRSR